MVIFLGKKVQNCMIHVQALNEHVVNTENRTNSTNSTNSTMFAHNLFWANTHVLAKPIVVP